MPGKKTEKREKSGELESNPSTNNQNITLSIEVKKDQKSTKSHQRDSLEIISALSAFAALLAAMLRGLLPNENVIGACPIQMNSGFKVLFEIQSELPLESMLATATSSLFEKVCSFFHEISLSSDILKVGNDVAKLISAGELTSQPKINPAKHDQNETAFLDSDGNIWVTITTGNLLVKRFRKLLHLAGFVNAGGYKITLKIANKNFNLTPLPVNAAKADWVVTQTLRLSPLITGFHPEHKTVEIFHDDAFLVQSVPSDNSELYIQAMQCKKAMEVMAEVSRPSNPFLSDPPKLRISETLKIVDSLGQDELDLSQTK